MKRILIVGRDFSSLRRYLESNDFDYLILRDVTTTKYPDKKIKKRIVCDFSSQQSILDTLSKIDQKIDGVIATYENYILPSAWIAKSLNLPGIPIAAAEACTDKETMRQLFANAPIKISPAFKAVSSRDELIEFASNHQFPLILKPANLAKSLLVTKSHNLEELLNNFELAQGNIKNVYKKYAPHRQPKLLVEEFLFGSIHSVDAFIDHDGEPHVLEQVVDYQTGYDIGYDDNFHYSRLLPSKLSAQDQRALREVAAVGCKALDMKSSPAHVEIIMTPGGPRIVEIGARNGGYRERMHSIANNIDILGAALALSLGEQPNITATKSEPCAVLELFPKTAGNFVGISHYEELEKLSSLNYLSIKAKEGNFVGKSADGYKMCAIVILHNTNVEQFEKDLAIVNQNVYIKTT